MRLSSGNVNAASLQQLFRIILLYFRKSK